jgi:peptidoglycan/xylan/chitin deacetylase (PgdA/CDA1 family)
VHKKLIKYLFVLLIVNLAFGAVNPKKESDPLSLHLDKNTVQTITGAVAMYSTSLTNPFWRISNHSTAVQGYGLVEIHNDSASGLGVHIVHTDPNNSQGGLRLDSPSPEIEFVETDAPTPTPYVGKFEVRVQGDEFSINSRLLNDASFDQEFIFTHTPDLVKNILTFSSGATGSNPSISAGNSDDTNAGINLIAKGSGSIIFDADTLTFRGTHDGIFSMANTTGTRTYYLPNSTGTLATQEYAALTYQPIITATAPILKSVANALLMYQSSSSVDGYLDNGDWTTFNNKQDTITVSDTATIDMVKSASNIYANVLESGLTTVVKLDQTTPQTISNGIPFLNQVATAFTSDTQIINKSYVDNISSTYANTGEIVPDVNETVITNFASGHGYAKGSQGVLTDDTTDFIIGSQSLKLASNSALEAHADKTGLTIDLTGKEIVIYMKISSLTNLVGASGYARIMFAEDSGFTKYYEATLSYAKLNSGQRSWADGKWHRLVYTFSELTATGAPNRAGITAIRIQMDDNNNSTTLNVNSIRTMNENSTGMCSITFDDGWESQYTEARKKLDEYGFKATLYCIPAGLGAANYMTLQQAKDLQNLSGWQIASHYQTDLTTLTGAQVEAALRSTKEYLITNGFKGYEDFAYPNGAYNDTVLPIVQKYFRSGRTVASYYESFPPANLHQIRVFSVLNTTTAAAMTTAIDKAILNKEWLIFVFHKITTPASSLTDCTIADFGTVVDYINSSGISLKTIEEVLNNARKSNTLNLNQTTVQQIDGGAPLLNRTAAQITNPLAIANKTYVDTAVAPCLTNTSLVNKQYLRCIRQAANVYNIDIDFDNLIVANTSLSSGDLTIDCDSGTGANALDTGTFAASKWYAIQVIYNPTTTTTAGLISLSRTAPTLPAGYTIFRFIGWAYSTSDVEIRDFDYCGGSYWSYDQNYAALSGGTQTAFTAVDASAYIPPTAILASAVLDVNDNASTSSIYIRATGDTSGGIATIVGTGASATRLISNSILKTNTSQSFDYKIDADDTSATIYINGYYDMATP